VDGWPTGIASGSSAITIVAAGFPFFTNVTGAAASAVPVSATRHARSTIGNLIRIVGSSLSTPQLNISEVGRVSRPVFPGDNGHFAGVCRTHVS
jgi:hypothetical protein